MSEDKRELNLSLQGEKDLSEIIDLFEDLQEIEEKRKESYDGLKELISKLKQLEGRELEEIKEEHSSSIAEIANKSESLIEEMLNREKRLKELNERESQILDVLMRESNELEKLQDKLIEIRKNF